MPRPAQGEQLIPDWAKDPKAWFANLSPDEKEQVLSTLGELIGGTGGAMAGGGVASIPAAGAGAVIGRNAALGLAKALGVELPKRTASQEAMAQLGTFGRNAAGEGIGRGIPMAGAATRNAVRKVFKPSEQAAAVAAKADAINVPMTLAMRSDAPTARVMDVALEKFPLSTQVVRDARKKAYVPFAAKLQKTAESFHPGPATDDVTGEALQSGLEANRAAAKDYFRPNYERVTGSIGDVSADATPLAEISKEIVDSVPEEAAKFFPSAALSKIRQLAGLGGSSELDAIAMSQAGAPFAALPQAQQATVLDIAERIGVNTQTAPEMKIADLIGLRTQVLEAERLLRHGSPAFNRSSLPKLRASIDDLIESRLASDPQHAQAYEQWRDLNRQYRDIEQKLYPPPTPVLEGNAMAGKIERQSNPELLPRQATASVTPLRETRTAVEPGTVAALPGGTPPTTSPIPALQRNRTEALINESRAVNRNMGDEPYVDPRKIEKKLDQNGQVYDELLGPEKVSEIRDTVDVGKAITSPEFLYGNPSGTARVGELLREGRNIVTGAATLGGMALGDGDTQDRVKRGAMIFAGLYSPRLIAKAVTNPNVARSLTGAMEPVAEKAGGAIAGTLGRLPFSVNLPQPNEGGYFDPVKLGAIPVQEDFDPLKLGAVPVR